DDDPSAADGRRRAVAGAATADHLPVHEALRQTPARAAGNGDARAVAHPAAVVPDASLDLNLDGCEQRHGQVMPRLGVEHPDGSLSRCHCLANRAIHLPNRLPPAIHGEARGYRDHTRTSRAGSSAACTSRPHAATIAISSVATTTASSVSAISSGLALNPSLARPSSSAVATRYEKVPSRSAVDRWSACSRVAPRSICSPR